MGAKRAGASGPPAWVISGALLNVDYAGNRAWDGAVKTPASLTAITRALPAKLALTSAGAYTSFGADTLAMTDLGLNGEEGQTNNVQFSNALTNAAWLANNAAVTAGQASPDAASTAGLLNDGVVVTVIHSLNPANMTFASGTVYVAYGIFKASTSSLVQLTMPTAQFSGLGYANFDLSGGTVSATGGTLVGSGIQSIGNGWYLCWIAATATASTAGRPVNIIRITSGVAARQATYSGTNTSILVWNPQTVAALSSTLVCPTSPIIVPSSSAIARAADNISVTQGAWFTAASGAWYIKARVPLVTLPGAVALAGNGNKGISIGLSTGGDKMRLQVFQGSQRGDTGTNSAALTPGATVKAALSYDGVGTPLFSVNGATVASAATPSQSDFDGNPLQLLADNTGTPAHFWNDFIQEIAFLPVQTQNQLNALTA